MDEEWPDHRAHHPGAALIIDLRASDKGEMVTIPTLPGKELDSKALHAPGYVVLDFYQESCPPCRALEPRLERIAKMHESEVAVYRIDLERDMPVAERFGVQSLPTVLVLHQGKEVERLDGLITDEQLKAAFGRASGSGQREQARSGEAE